MTQAREQLRVRDAGVAYRAARTTAIVGAVFSGVFVVLLIANLIGSAIIGPARELTLDAMKLQVQKDPGNEALLAEIRQLDLRIRRNRLWRWEFGRKASYMLLASAVVMLVSAKLASLFVKGPSWPQPASDVSETQIKEARHARWAVVGGLAVLAACAGLLWTRGSVDFGQVRDQGPPYASMQEKREQWHRFRGPGGAGVSVYTNMPTRWGGKTGEGIVWKTAIPLPGRNSPVVWNDRVFLSGADPNEQRVYCFDAGDGKLLWRGEVPTAPVAAEAELDLMEDTGYAACTMATDGRRVYAIFPTGDVAGFDFKGRRLWYKSLGLPDNVYGYAASLDTYKDRVLIQYDQGDGSEGKSRVYALDGLSGRVVWETKRQLPNAWTSPVVVEVEGQYQFVTLADPYAVAYDPEDGSEIWRAECAGGDVAPSPICAGGFVFAIEPYAQLVAIKPTGQGDVTETHIAWRMEEGAPDICSPVSDGTYIYLMESEGYLMCCNVADGKMVYEHDLRESFRASPSIVGDKLYLLEMNGTMHIAEVGPEYNEIAQCELGEECYASPAFVNGRIYIRGAEHLYCIGQNP